MRCFCFVSVDAFVRPSRQQFFRHVRTFFCLPEVNQYQAEDEVSCSRTEHSVSSSYALQHNIREFLTWHGIVSLM